MTTKDTYNRMNISPLPSMLCKALCVITLLLVWPSSALAAVRVAATTGDLAALAEAVGREHVYVDLLSAPTEDPHYVDPRPDKIVKLSRADLLIVTGLSLEIGWLPQLQVNSRNRDIQAGGNGYFDASMHIDVMGAAQGPVDRSQGDVHPGGSPHYTRDPKRMASVAEALGEKLASIDPEHAEDYRSQAKEFAGKARDVAKQERERFRELSKRQRQIVVYHKSFEYLADLLELSVVITIEPRPGIEPSPRHVSKVLSDIRSKNVNIILQEEFYPRNVSDTLAELTGAKLLVIPAHTRFDNGQTYFEHFEETSHALFEALSSGDE